jgi:hypothetical protein
MKINEGKTQAIYVSRRRRMPEDDLQPNGRNIPFVNSAKYLGVISDRRMTWRLHIEKTSAKAFGTYIRTYSIFKSKHLSGNIKLIAYRALIRSIITYACPTWEFAADIHLMKLQRLQNRVLRAIGNFHRRTPVRDLHLALKMSYMYDYRALSDSLKYTTTNSSCSLPYIILYSTFLSTLYSIFSSEVARK